MDRHQRRRRHPGRGKWLGDAEHYGRRHGQRFQRDDQPIGSRGRCGHGSAWSLGSTWPNKLSVCGGGSLIINSGGTVSDMGGVLGAGYGSLDVSPSRGNGRRRGSTWTNAGYLTVGGMTDWHESGNGTLMVLDGGVVSSGWGSVGSSDNSWMGAYIGAGTVTVSGTGSKWVNTTSLDVVYGTVAVAGSGSLTTGSLLVYGSDGYGHGALVSIDVGNGSLLAVGNSSGLGTDNGTLENDGTVRVLAGARVAAGHTYAPIQASTWSGTGTYQAIGGTWDATNHQFTVSATQSGTAGTPVAIDLSQTQRVLVTDAASGASIGASFLAATSPTPITFTASLLGSSTFTSLAGRFGPGEVRSERLDLFDDRLCHRQPGLSRRSVPASATAAGTCRRARRVELQRGHLDAVLGERSGL